MKKITHILTILFFALTTFCSIGCSEQQEKMLSSIDSLNLVAYKMRYVSMDSTILFANKALCQTLSDNSDKASALANLAFVKYMQMDYDSANILYNKSLQMSENDIDKMEAYVGLLKVCYATSENKDFYDYSFKIYSIINKYGTDTEIHTFKNKLQETKWNYAISEFYMASATFFSNQMQDDEARACFKMVRDNFNWIKNDTAQQIRYFHLCSSIGQGSVDDNLKVQYITDAYVMARQHNLLYMEAGATQEMASYIINFNGASKIDAFKSLLNINNIPEDSIGLMLAERALSLYKRYGSVYSWALSHLTLSQFYLKTGNFSEALNEAEKAEELAKQGKSQEWMAKIHEHLSIVYGSLNNKVASDEHRNIYLDILDATRQDKMYEQRKDVLEADEIRLHWAFMAAYTIGAIVLVLAITLFIIIRKKQHEKRRRILELMNEEKAALEIQLRKNKRNYIDKCTSLSIVNGIRPFLSRAILALNNIKTDIDRLYITELLEKINEYNDVLTHWIKMEQGDVKLHIETFELQPLFSTLEKSRNIYEQKGIELIVENTNLSVKADRALTLFMMNTLLDNARKFTEKGYVKLQAKEGENFVEISVIDTGPGFDTQVAMSFNLYDTKLELHKAQDSKKGFGFGLMNCRGIIEKYKKTSRMFDVCKFNAESKIGEGSRFSFCLPKGIIQIVKILFIIFTFHTISISTIIAQNQNLDSNRLLDMTIPSDTLLTIAHEYADSVFYANVNRQHGVALQYADSALKYINEYYLKQNPSGSKILVKDGGRYMPEIDLWKENFPTDYITILDIRNEIAIAALALQNIQLYKYNNNVYARLYKLCGQDKSLVYYCETLAKTNEKTRVAICIVIALILIGIIIFLIAHKYLIRIANSLNNEENKKIEYEDNNLHVQNMILDNCLSTIKHETMYYPARILNTLNNSSSQDDCSNAHELALYYENVLGVLTEHALQQLENVQFKRKIINVSNIIDYWNQKMVIPKQNLDSNTPNFLGDEEMLHYLIDNLIMIGKEHNASKEDLNFYFAISDEFIKFAFEDKSLHMSSEERERLFYPDNLKYDTATDRLHGTQYLICKQIIREHDEHCGKRGCRIYTEIINKSENDNNFIGIRIIFTLPTAK
ncbi:MAG: DUF5113 domain-containing protein [Bacteroidaceae bacterium]|nr:DUF5113 domain-containing protein [Bacteroidaceae bacterium]